jgi:hypothetical protein
MTRASLSLLSLALGASLIGAGKRSSSPSTSVSRHHAGVAAGSIARKLAAVTSVPPMIITAPRYDEHAEAMRRLREGAPGTYIGEILRERDSSIARWPDRHGVPLSVWIQPQSTVPDFTDAYVGRVRAAFEEWGALHLPVQFRFVGDSAAADVHVTWINHFDQPISGRTRWARDDDWLITDANIILAVHHYQGEQLDQDAMRAMALHEIGHLLGLDHTSDSLAIMAPRVRVRELSNADRATVRLLYALPAGSLR